MSGAKMHSLCKLAKAFESISSIAALHNISLKLDFKLCDLLYDNFVFNMLKLH